LEQRPQRYRLLRTRSQRRLSIPWPRPRRRNPSVFSDSRA
jgi:hypothetical protein